MIMNYLNKKTPSKRRLMGVKDATVDKSKKFAISMAIVAFLFGVAWLIQPVFAVEFYDENYQITDYRGMFNYTAPAFDHQPMVITMNGTVNGTPVELMGQFSGNISVVSRPVGWDLVVPMLIYYGILLTAITICVVILTGYFLLRLHK